MQFGIFDQNDRGPLALPDHYEAWPRLVEFRDRAGFDLHHVREHHAMPLSAIPATGVWLAAVAQRTRRLRFGPLVCILPIRHPLRVAEEACLLGQISGGRLGLGVGCGISPYELGYHGVDAAEAPAMYREAFDLLLRALAWEVVSFEGRWWRCRGAPVALRPLQCPHPPLWYACATPEAAAWPARNAISVVCSAPAPRVRDAPLARLGETGANCLVCRFAFGDLTNEESPRSARLLAEEVRPALRGRHGAVAPAAAR